MAEPIRTPRLNLVPMTPEFLEASLLGDREQAEQLVAASLPATWPHGTPMLRRLDQLREDPTLQPWLLRAMVLQSHRTVIGCIGFHDRPGALYLKDLAPGGVELGYTVFEPWRRQGYAREAIEELMAWARREHRITRFVVSISPTNHASLELARRLDFKRIGAHLDEEDGPEDIFERRFV
ncbi:MAG: GNAT family N-acetyltransferase [Myxococcales bacterium]